MVYRVEEEDDTHDEDHEDRAERGRATEQKEEAGDDLANAGEGCVDIRNAHRAPHQIERAPLADPSHHRLGVPAIIPELSADQLRCAKTEHGGCQSIAQGEAQDLVKAVVFGTTRERGP